MENASKVDVALISDGEMPACAEVISKSFGHDAPFVDIYFPNHGTPSGQAQASKRLAAWKQSSESSTFLKAIARADEGSQEHIIGLAAIVEGTPVGRKLYEQCGLSAEIEEMRFDVGEEYVERRKPKLVFLTREPPT
ncbi:hypothetical protein UCDDA912_g03546 [Diaporthe ampelina]|uniref:Uncharacterized protein n=1 Tax=Diaporthe ampelina TaxID=1214573 RepID=A0A0G2I9Q2_9PEZI|nr:hypothetical protein UCDDA912_g03546 [Diaporthe ampelina]